MSTLKTANQAAVAGLVDIDTSARSLVSSVNAYKNAGLTAAEASDILFVSVREGQTTFRELADFMGNVSPLASSAGVKFDELAGAIAAITKGGVETSKATIGLRSAITSVIKPSDDAKKAAKTLGIEFSTSALRAKGLAGFLKDIGEKTGGSEQALAKLFGNVRGLSSILKVVTGDFDDFVRIQKETKTAAGATKKAADEIKKSLDFKLTQVTAELKAFGLNLIKIALPAIQTFVKGIGVIIDNINKLSGALQKPPKKTMLQQLVRNRTEAFENLVQVTRLGEAKIAKVEVASGKRRDDIRNQVNQNILRAHKVLRFEEARLEELERNNEHVN